MSLLAKLQIGDNSAELYNEEYQLAGCSYRFARKHNGRLPDSDARCGVIEATVIVPGKENLKLYEWYIHQSFHSGRIIFDMSSQSTQEFNPQKILTFEEAQCFAISEEYHINGTRRRMLKMELVAARLTIDSVPFVTFK
ncbi:MAG: type VI secretion system tube protein TssD [Parabacteroides sp.]